MSAISRIDRSVLGQWWWTVDRWTLLALFLIIAFGAVMVLAASPPVAERIEADPFYFLRRHLVLLPVAIAVMIGLSLASPRQVKRLAVVGLVGSLVLLTVTPFIGEEIKGARRWISLAGFSLQPSELLKPCLAVATAWMFAEWRKGEGFPGHLVAMTLWLISVGLLLAQPDLGQTVLVTFVFFAQFFLAGLPWILVIGLVSLGLAGVVGAYLVFPHVSSRIDRFLDPASGDTYQVDRSLEAFRSGGLFGRGPGEGVVKAHLPDAHADFVLAVAGEELGAVVCIFLVLLFAFVVLRGYARLLQEPSLFALVAGAGLLTQFGLQALINMASTLRLMPAKGMTLPFVSYGGSSMIALAIGMGMALALTRRRTTTPEGVV